MMQAFLWEYFLVTIKHISNMYLSVIKNNYLLIVIIIVGIFLRMYRLTDLMVFIGDQGWFYMSARDLLLEGKVPLLGITSSHTWLHQGPLWTYLLAIGLFLFKFNPIGGAYITILLDALTIFVLYKLGSELLSKRIGFISSVIYSVSPLAIIHARMPYHTSPIPLLVSLFLLVLYRLINGNVFYFPFIIFLLTLLYNFELATFILVFIVFLFAVYDLVYKKVWVSKLLDKKIIAWSIIAFVIPMTPILIYDFNNGFKQTIIFLLWIPYSVLKPLFVHSSESYVAGFSTMLHFIYEYNKRFIFLPNGNVALVVSLSSIFYLFFKVYKNIQEKKSTVYAFIFLCFSVPLIGLFVNKTPSEAYLPMLFPMLIVIIAVCVDKLLSVSKLTSIVYILFVLFIFANSNSLLSKNYLINGPYGYGVSFSKRLQVVEKIIVDSGSKKYQLIGMGEGSEFESFTMNYEYLLWWKSKNKSVKEMVDTTYYIEEKNGTILLSE
jgi:4-amino-4-deoxy-L-arabinose transferase-like glycosyltransferase